MKKYHVILLGLLLGFCLPVAARERIYISTDRSAYVSGDLVWCSAFSLGGSQTRSGVAYLELFSADGTAVQAKIALVGGRGAGVLQLPASLPTGNYLLCAYTSGDDDRAAILRDARILSVFNGFSTARVENGVRVAAAVAPARARDAGTLRVLATPASRGGELSVELDNRLGKAMSLSVSVYHEDALAPAEEKGIADACTRVRLGTVEEEGDIIHAHLSGPDRDRALSRHPFAIISSPGNTEDLYTALFTQSGQMSFRTYNIFGHRDLVCEVAGLDEAMDCYLELESPFLGLESRDIPQLTIDPAFEPGLLERMAAIPSSRAAAADTLLAFLPKRESRLFDPDDPDCIRYRMADYTQMNTFHECVIEYIPELRWRREGLQVLKSVGRGVNNLFAENVLVLIDGVPVLDHSSIIEMDATLLREVDIFRRSYSIGARTYDAVVSLITTHRNISTVKFPRTVRIFDFEGASYPLAYKRAPGQGQDLRQTIYWHPSVQVEAGEAFRIPVQAPAYAGRFRVVVEGLDIDGLPVRQETSVEVR